jgi:hypothetical protein
MNPILQAIFNVFRKDSRSASGESCPGEFRRRYKKRYEEIEEAGKKRKKKEK